MPHPELLENDSGRATIQGNTVGYIKIFSFESNSNHGLLKIMKMFVRYKQYKKELIK